MKGVKPLGYRDVITWDGAACDPSDERKNRKSHPSQRNGFTKTIVKIVLSTIPLRRER
jgi:hypothetical protein